ncbi:MAG: hypothetical protein WA813_26020, partial [Beijerinckiaceae bacterium]
MPRPEAEREAFPQSVSLGWIVGGQEHIASSPRVSAFVWTSSFKPFQEGCSKGVAPWQRVEPP